MIYGSAAVRGTLAGASGSRLWSMAPLPGEALVWPAASGNLAQESGPRAGGVDGEDGAMTRQDGSP